VSAKVIAQSASLTASLICREVSRSGELCGKLRGAVQTKTGAFSMKSARIYWLRGGDLNPRPLGYEPNELPDCSTPRHGRLAAKPHSVLYS
jgi:hypothetical protein